MFPKKGEKHPSILFFVGLLYSSLACILVRFVFSQDVVLERSSGVLIMMFTSLFSVFFLFFALRRDEKENIADKTDGKAFRDDWRILKMLLFLFVGFIAGFLVWQMVFPGQTTFNSQMQTYCVISKPLQYNACLDDYKIDKVLNGVEWRADPKILGAIFENNLVVSAGILIFSLLFGAGVIFILAWNASIIASVMAFSAKYSFSNVPAGVLKFTLHGIPEIAAYFLIAMAGGMSSFAISSYVRNKLGGEGLKRVVRRSLWIILGGIVLLGIASLIEVYVSSLI